MVMLKLEDQPPLIQAIFLGEIDDVRSLLDTKLDVNYQDAEKRSPLHAAAFKGDKELAELLLAQGARVNTKDCKWLTPLHRACGVGSEETVALLLSHNADTTARDRQWQTPLHIAAANNAVECISHLLHYVPNVNVTDRSGRTALHHAALNGHNDVVELLISKGCIVNACDKKDCRPIHWAAHLGHVDTMELLMRNGADIHVKDRNQYTPLHVAAASGMLYACRLLLHAGADVDAQNSFGNTPLHIACLNGHLPVCQELAMYNANLEAVNYRGQTPLHIAAASTHGVACLTYLLDQNVNINKQSLDGRTALHMSAIHGRFTRSKTLIDKGAIVDSQDKNGNTALHIAAQYGHDILTTTLLDYGADPNKRGYEGRTPLHSCCLSGFVEVSRKFIQIKVDLNTADDTGKTAVHCAAYKGSVECLDLLVSQGANFKLQDMYGRTPLHYSATQGHYTCVFTLVGIGAPVNVIDNEGCTPLHLAAAYDLEGRCVEYLLQHKADPKMKDNRGYTPVHYAVNGSNSNSLGHLLEALGKNYNFHDEGMPLNTPLHLAARRDDIKILNSVISYFPDVNIKNDKGYTPLLIAAREGHTHSVQMLLRYGAKVGICEDVYNMSPVHYSAKNGHMHCLALLVDNTEDRNIIDKPDKFNRTALMLAISGSHLNCVLTLLKSEANPNIVDSDQHSSLFRAVVTNQNNVVQYLISKGALVSEPDINGKTVLHLASACGQFVCLQTIMLYMSVEKAASLDNHDFSALHWGCYHGYYTCVEYLLKKGVFKKIEGNPFSPVHCATFIGSERCLELLYNAFGAEIVKLIDTRKRTPLHIAALHGHTDCARYLLEQGAEIESKDEFGRTALIAASQNGQSQMLELLIAYKANVKSCDNNGNTALHMACLKKHSHTALLLLEYINDIDTINVVNNDKKTPLHLSARNGLVEVTRNLIKKGSSVLAVDSNGLTPALCCAPNPSVAQCLAIILANHPMQFPVVNHSTKADDQELFQKLAANPTLPNVTLRTSLIQTDMSLQRDPRELFDEIVQKIKPEYVKKALKSHRKKAHIVYSSPNLHKTHKSKPEIILIERYGKNDGFDDSFKEAKGLSLHRSFSEIALAPTISGDSVSTSRLDLRCNYVEKLDSVLEPIDINVDGAFGCDEIKEGPSLKEKDLELVTKPFKQIDMEALDLNYKRKMIRATTNKDRISKPACWGLNKNMKNFAKTNLNSINICMAELTQFHNAVEKNFTVANCTIPQKDSKSSEDKPSTSSQSSSSPGVVNYEDAYKPVTKRLKTPASKMEKNEEKMRCQGDVGVFQEDKTELSTYSPIRLRKKLCSCQYVCEKCVLKNCFDEFEGDEVLTPASGENLEDRGNRSPDYLLHRVTTRKLGINDEEFERDTRNERQLTPAELAAFLRDEPQSSNPLGAYKNQMEHGLKISTNSSPSNIWPKVTLDSDRIIMPSDLDQASTTLIKTIESQTSNLSPANSVQLLCNNFDEEKPPSLSNRMSRDSLDDADGYPYPDIDEDEAGQRYVGDSRGEDQTKAKKLKGLNPEERNVDGDMHDKKCDNLKSISYSQSLVDQDRRKSKSKLLVAKEDRKRIIATTDQISTVLNKQEHDEKVKRCVGFQDENTNNYTSKPLEKDDNRKVIQLRVEKDNKQIFEGVNLPQNVHSGCSDPTAISNSYSLKTTIGRSKSATSSKSNTNISEPPRFNDTVEVRMLKKAEPILTFSNVLGCPNRVTNSNILEDLETHSGSKGATGVFNSSNELIIDDATNHTSNTCCILQSLSTPTGSEVENIKIVSVLKNIDRSEQNDSDRTVIKSNELKNSDLIEEGPSPTLKLDNVSSLKKETILDDIGRKMESNLEESSSILDRIITTMQRSIEETNAAAILDSIDGMKQLMMHSNLILDDVGKTIEDNSYKPLYSLPGDAIKESWLNDDPSKMEQLGRIKQPPARADVGKFSNPLSSRLHEELMKSSNSSTLRRFNDNPINLQTGSTLRGVEKDIACSSTISKKKSSSDVTTMLENDNHPPSPALSSRPFNDNPVNRKASLLVHTAGVLGSPLSSPSHLKNFDAEETSSKPSSATRVKNIELPLRFIEETSTTHVKNMQSPLKLSEETASKPSRATLLKNIQSPITFSETTSSASLNRWNYESKNPKPSAVFNIPSTGLKDNLKKSKPNIFNLDYIKRVKAIESTCVENTVSSSDDVKPFKNSNHCENLESIIIDNAVVTSSIDPTHVLGRPTFDCEYFDVARSLEQGNLFRDSASASNKKLQETEIPNLHVSSKIDNSQGSNDVTGSLLQETLLQDYVVEPSIFENDGIESEDEACRSDAPETGDVSVVSRRNSKQEDKVSRKSCSKGGIKMKMKKSDDVQSSNSHESFLHRNSHYGVYAAHGNDFTREEDAHSQNSSDNEYY